MALSNQAPATRTSLWYITGGAVVIVWTLVWLIYCAFNPPSSGDVYYAIFGFMATGGVLLFIGLRLGKIGRAAKQAESPQVVVPPAAPVVPAADQTPVVAASTSDGTAMPANAVQTAQPVTMTSAHRI